jgi:hypothetical protein
MEIERNVKVKKIGFDVKTGAMKIEVEPIEFDIKMKIPEWLEEAGCNRLFRYAHGFAVGRFGEGDMAEWKQVDMRSRSLGNPIPADDLKSNMENLAECNAFTEEESLGIDVKVNVRNFRQ